MVKNEAKMNIVQKYNRGTTTTSIEKTPKSYRVWVVTPIGMGKLGDYSNLTIAKTKAKEFLKSIIPKKK